MLARLARLLGCSGRQFSPSISTPGLGTGAREAVVSGSSGAGSGTPLGSGSSGAGSRTPVGFKSLFTGGSIVAVILSVGFVASSRPVMHSGPISGQVWLAQEAG